LLHEAVPFAHGEVFIRRAQRRDDVVFGGAPGTFGVVGTVVVRWDVLDGLNRCAQVGVEVSGCLIIETHDVDAFAEF